MKINIREEFKLIKINKNNKILIKIKINKRK